MASLEKIISSCDWCCGPSELNIGPGYFSDYDSDLSYGIPLCGGCGTLGIRVDSEEFKTAARSIMKLRFEYCPDPREPGPKVPAIIRVQKLEQIEKEVTAHYQRYGQQEINSFAQEIVNKGYLKPIIQYLRPIKDDEIMSAKNWREWMRTPPSVLK